MLWIRNMNWISTYDAISFPEAAFLLVSAKEARRLAATDLKHARALETRLHTEFYFGACLLISVLLPTKRKAGSGDERDFTPNNVFQSAVISRALSEVYEPYKAEIESENTNTTTYHKD